MFLNRKYLCHTPSVSVIPAELHSSLGQSPAAQCPSSEPPPHQQAALLGGAGMEKRSRKICLWRVCVMCVWDSRWFQSLSSPRSCYLQATPYSPCSWRNTPLPSWGPRTDSRSPGRSWLFDATCWTVCISDTVQCYYTEVSSCCHTHTKFPFSKLIRLKLSLSVQFTSVLSWYIQLR